MVLVALMAGLAFFAYNFQFVVISGESMSPTLHSNQRILVCKALWALGPVGKGDVVVVNTREGYVVKRIAYMEGEAVKEEDRPFAEPMSPPFVVPKGSVYVLGDNRAASEDSRIFGPVKLTQVVGKAVFVE